MATEVIQTFAMRRKCGLCATPHPRYDTDIYATVLVQPFCS